MKYLLETNRGNFRCVGDGVKKPRNTMAENYVLVDTQEEAAAFLGDYYREEIERWETDLRTLPEKLKEAREIFEKLHQ